MLKISNNQKVKNKIPGYNINNEPNHVNIQKAIKRLFPKEFQKYESQVTETNKKQYHSKLFLCLLFEMLLRKYHQKHINRTYFLSYDIVYLSFLDE